ncbi:MAG: CoA ester lyase [Candidatus Methanomethylicia archaeon]
MVKLYRSILFTPGNQWSRIEKASTLNPDAILLDLEDSVPIDQKDEARSMVLKALRELNWGGKDRGVRINGLDTKYWVLDIYEVIKGSPDFLVIPKVKSPIDIIAIDKILTSLEGYYNLKKTYLSIAIEDSEGLRNIYDIVKASDRVISIGFGRADFTADVGCEDREDILFIPKIITSFAAATAGIQALDTVYLNFKDVEGLEKEARISKAMGYTGKFAIHPIQIDVINKVFTPSESEVEYARKVIDVYEEAIRKGLGAVALEGKMIDEAVVKKARKILMLARK